MNDFPRPGKNICPGGELKITTWPVNYSIQMVVGTKFVFNEFEMECKKFGLGTKTEYEFIEAVEKEWIDGSGRWEILALEKKK